MALDGSITTAADVTSSSQLPQHTDAVTRNTVMEDGQARRDRPQKSKQSPNRLMPSGDDYDWSSPEHNPSLERLGC